MKSSIQPRKQRRALHNNPLHLRNRQLRAHLSDDLILKFGKRSTSVRVGDTVKVVRGKHTGTSGEVLTVNRSRFVITVEGVTVTKADGKTKAKPVHPSDVVLTKLVLTDKRRREKLGASEADAEATAPKAKKGAKAEKAAPETDPRARAAAKRAMKTEEEEQA
jgi:large subunit ribosomal protein L24